MTLGRFDSGSGRLGGGGRAGETSAFTVSGVLLGPAGDLASALGLRTTLGVLPDGEGDGGVLVDGKGVGRCVFFLGGSSMPLNRIVIKWTTIANSSLVSWLSWLVSATSLE